MDTLRGLSEELFTPNHNSLSLPTAQLSKQKMFPKSLPHTHSHLLTVREDLKQTPTLGPEPLQGDLFPHIQPKPSLVHLEAVSCCLGENKPNPTWLQPLVREV